MNEHKTHIIRRYPMTTKELNCYECVSCGRIFMGDINTGVLTDDNIEMFMVNKK
jgi:hypothetical protein